MKLPRITSDHLTITRHLLRWTLLVIPVSLVVGSLVITSAFRAHGATYWS